MTCIRVCTHTERHAHVQPWEFYQVKNNKIMKLIINWINLEYIMLSNQTKNENNFMF